MSDYQPIDSVVQQAYDDLSAELERAISTRAEAALAALRRGWTVPPPGVHLWRYNRRIAAQRCGWPPGAIHMCKRLEREFPGWRITWMAANTIRGWERPAGYYASRDDVNLAGADQLRRLPEDGVTRKPVVFGATPAELRLRIEVMQARIAVEEAKREAFYEWTRVRLT